jgi:hypothetical protein
MSGDRFTRDLLPILNNYTNIYLFEQNSWYWKSISEAIEHHRSMKPHSTINLSNHRTQSILEATEHGQSLKPRSTIGV